MTEQNKVLILGVDGLDPSLVNRFRAEGIMPNFDTFIRHHPAYVDISGHRRNPRYPRHHLLLGPIQKRYGDLRLQSQFTQLQS